MIKYEDFSKLEIKIGEVISAEKVPETDKLLKLEVDFGEEKRIIVSGIAQAVLVEEIIGKQYPFITNLEPRIIRGIESNGMILAIDDNGPVLFSPNKEVANGSIIK